MTVANLFAKHRSGEISKEKFLYEVRKDAQLPFISNLTSYDDAIKMLKQKSVIKEVMYGNSDGDYDQNQNDKEEIERVYDAGLAAFNAGDTERAEKLYKRARFLGAYLSWSEIELPPYEQATAVDESFLGLGKKKESTIYDFKHPNLKDVNIYQLAKIIQTEYQKEYKKEPTVDQAFAAIKKHANEIEGRKKNASDYAIANQIIRKAGRTLAESKKTVKSAIKEQADLHLQIDRLNPILVKKAVNSELAKLPMIDAHTYQKTTEKVVKKLQKDPRAYDDVVVSNAKEINKIDDKNKMMPVKKELKDPHNQMKSPKGIEKPKANTKASKTENKKGSPKGVKEMKGSKKGHAGVKQMETPGTKETVLESLLSFMFKKKLNEDIHHEYGAGQGIDTPDGHGTIKDIIGSTITLEFQDGSQKDYQINQLNHFREEASKPINEPPPLEVKKDNPTMDEKKDAVIKKVMEFLGKKNKIKKEALTAKTGDSSHNQSVYNKINKIPGQARTDIKKAYDSGKTIDI
jgi:hypothetical protein